LVTYSLILERCSLISNVGLLTDHPPSDTPAALHWLFIRYLCVLVMFDSRTNRSVEPILFYSVVLSRNALVNHFKW